MGDSGVVSLCYSAAALSSVLGLSVVVVAAICIFFILEVGNKNLQKITQELPRSAELIRASGIPFPVLIAVCEQTGVSIMELTEIYQKEAMERKATTERTFGFDNRTVKRFLEADNAKFLHEGYIGEDIITKAQFSKEETVMMKNEEYGLNFHNN